jgi:hypothetical protein
MALHGILITKRERSTDAIRSASRPIHSNGSRPKASGRLLQAAGATAFRDDESLTRASCQCPHVSHDHTLQSAFSPTYATHSGAISAWPQFEHSALAGGLRRRRGIRVTEFMSAPPLGPTFLIGVDCAARAPGWRADRQPRSHPKQHDQTCGGHAGQHDGPLGCIESQETSTQNGALDHDMLQPSDEVQ